MLQLQQLMLLLPQLILQLQLLLLLLVLLLWWWRRPCPGLVRLIPLAGVELHVRTCPKEHVDPLALRSICDNTHGGTGVEIGNHAVGMGGAGGVRV